MAGRLIKGAAALSELVRPASETDAPGLHRMLPVAPELSALLPGRGLRRGSTIAVAAGGSGTVSLMLALLSAASRAGSWCAVVGVPDLGALAAEENGIALDRLALIPNAGPDWPTVTGALIDGVDVVVMAIPGPVAAPIAARLVARARQRGSVLVPFGAWPGADVTLRVTAGAWEGLGQGHGRLRRRRVTVLARGRGAADRPRELTMWMPGMSVPPPIPPLRSSGPITISGPSASATPSASPASLLPSASPASLPLSASPAPLLPSVSPSSSVSPASSASVPSLPSPSVPSASRSSFASSSSSPPVPDGRDDVVDLSVDDAADLAMTDLARLSPSCVTMAWRSGRDRPGGSRRPRGRRFSRRVVDTSRPAIHRSSIRPAAARPAVPVWWEFVPAPVSGPAISRSCPSTAVPPGATTRLARSCPSTAVSSGVTARLGRSCSSTAVPPGVTTRFARKGRSGLRRAFGTAGAGSASSRAVGGCE